MTINGAGAGVCGSVRAGVGVGMSLIVGLFGCVDESRELRLVLC